MSGVARFFSTEVRFEGTMHQEEGNDAEVECQVVMNPVNPSEIQAQVFQSPDAFDGPVQSMRRAMEVSAGGRVRVEGGFGKKLYLVEGVVGTSEGGDKGTRLRLKVDDITELQAIPTQSDQDGVDQTVRFFIHPFKQISRALEDLTSRHPRHGYVHGWKYESQSNFEEGTWRSQIREMQVNDLPLEVGTHFQFEQAEAKHAECELVLPQIGIEVEAPGSGRPETVQDLRSQVQSIQGQLSPLWTALRFALGRRAYPFYQEINIHDHEEGVFYRSKRFWDRERTTHSTPGRTGNASELWELIEELAAQLQSLDDKDGKRARKAVDRYVEAFEAPNAELRLTLLHSALHLILVGNEYHKESNSARPEDVPKPSGGRVNWGLGKFIGVHEIEWQDLFSDDPDAREVYSFNRLRNDYLKRDRRGFLTGDNIRHVNVAQRLFERVFLAHHGVDPSEYPVLGQY
jgi:hypothetical protein